MGRTEGAGTFSRALPRRDGAKTAVRGLRQFSMAVDTPAHPPMKRAPAITASRRLVVPRATWSDSRVAAAPARQVARTAARSAAPPDPRPRSPDSRRGPGPSVPPAGLGLLVRWAGKHAAAIAQRSPAAGPGRGARRGVDQAVAAAVGRESSTARKSGVEENPVAACRVSGKARRHRLSSLSPFRERSGRSGRSGRTRKTLKTLVEPVLLRTC